LLDTQDIGVAEERGAALLSRYRLDVRREQSFNARVNGCSLGGVDLYYTNFGSTEVEVASAALADRFGIVIPLAGAMSLRYGSRELDVVAGSSAMIVSPETGFHMRWSDGFASLTVRIPRSEFAPVLRSLAPRADAAELSFDPLIDRPASLLSLRGSLQVLYEAVARAGAAENVPSPVATRVREQLVTTLVMMQPNVLSDRLCQPEERGGRGAVREALDLIESEAGAIGTIAELARRVGVTTRSLQSGFQREVGESPISYLHNVRLSRARAELLHTGSGAGRSVSDVAMRWGFRHPGRFAVYYRQRFGESPSETLRRSRL
jgi:AraC-like DNA-binding protein